MTKKRKPTAGYLNKLIDDLIHPYTKDYPALIIVDSLLRAIVEQDPSSSLTKFIRYNATTFLKQITINTKHRRKSQTKQHPSEHASTV
jgi:hypothetical protein